MSSGRCCAAATRSAGSEHAAPSFGGRTAAIRRSCHEIAGWLVPCAILAVMPKCPACLAAYLALWTGLGLSFSAATNVRGALLCLSVAALLFLIGKWINRIRTIFRDRRTETEPCNTGS